MKRKSLLVSLLAILAMVSFCRCCSARYNQPLVDPAPFPPDTTTIVQDSQTLMYTCFSGGGTRAMAMGYHVVDELAKIGYKTYIIGTDTVKTTLRDEIDYTSGVSGGAFVSAALLVYPQSEWQSFYQAGVARNIQGALVKRLFEIWNWPKLLSPYYNRTDMASEFYNRRIFKRKTFGQLPPHPVPYINTTVLASRSHFVFDDEYFRYIGSDIRSYPLGFACAASSAFPGGFPPMTLKNYSPYISPDSMLSNPRYRYAVRNEQTDIDQHAWADMYRFLKDTSNAWLHVSDGGIAGNTGIERVLDAFRTNGVINKAINNTKSPLKRLIFVVVNAGTDQPDESCSKRKAPNSLKVILYTTTTSMDLLSAERISVLSSKVQELRSIIETAKGRDPALAQLELPYMIEVNARNLKDPQLRQEFNVIPTSFDLSDEQLDVIRRSVLALLDDNSEWQRLKESIIKNK